MPPKNRFLHFYLVTALLFGTLGLFDSLFTLTATPPAVYVTTLSLLLAAFFLLNLAAFFTFWHQQLEKVALVLPIYHILSFLLFVVLSLFLIRDSLPESAWINFPVAGILLSLFEMAFSAYLLHRFKRADIVNCAA